MLGAPCRGVLVPWLTIIVLLYKYRYPPGGKGGYWNGGGVWGQLDLQIFAIPPKIFFARVFSKKDNQTLPTKPADFVR